MLLFIAIIAYMTVAIIAKPLESDSAEIVMKIEKINEQLPGNEESGGGKILRKTFIRLTFFFFPTSRAVLINKIVPAKPKNGSDDGAKQKKSQRNYPVYYVNTKVNGKFGKSVRAFTSDEFYELYPVKY